MIRVLRLGHRRRRDPRLTTHVCLTARAFGADGAVVAEADPELEGTVRDLVKRFGGPFTIHTGVSWRSYVERWQQDGGLVVHLTMYGERLEDVVDDLSGRDVLLVVGSEKVPAELYGLADRNVAVGNQPHSEVAALAVALDRLTQGAWERRRFDDAEVRIRPEARGKNIIED